MDTRKDDPLDYEKIARLEQELGLVPAKPKPRIFPPSAFPAPPAERPRVPVDAIYVCLHCGARMKGGAFSCNHCGGDTWTRDDDF